MTGLQEILSGRRQLQSMIDVPGKTGVRGGVAGNFLDVQSAYRTIRQGESKMDGEIELRFSGRLMAGTGLCAHLGDRSWLRIGTETDQSSDLADNFFGFDIAFAKPCVDHDSLPR